MKLENRGYGKTWKYADKMWNIPKDTEEGFIEDQNSPGQVLGIINDTIVVLESKDVRICNEQTWLRGNEDSEGWFKLKNPFTKLLLTAKQGDAYPIIEKNCSNYCLGTVLLNFTYNFFSALLKHQKVYVLSPKLKVSNNDIFSPNPEDIVIVSHKS